MPFTADWLLADNTRIVAKIGPTQGIQQRALVIPAMPDDKNPSFVNLRCTAQAKSNSNEGIRIT